MNTLNTPHKNTSVDLWGTLASCTWIGSQQHTLSFYTLGNGTRSVLTFRPRCHRNNEEDEQGVAAAWVSIFSRAWLDGCLTSHYRDQQDPKFFLGKVLARRDQRLANVMMSHWGTSPTSHSKHTRGGACQSRKRNPTSRLWCHHVWCESPTWCWAGWSAC